MRFSDNPISEYSAAHSAVLPSNLIEILNELDRETHLNVLMPQMLSGLWQGQWLAFFSKMVRPKRILEIGTYTGYSAICLAQGLQEGGVLHTIEVNEELKEIANKYWDKANLSGQIQQHIGDAMEIVDSLDETFDLVFIDADKQNYPNYYKKVVDKIPSGGFIIVDNVLWSGKVLDKDAKDKSTAGIKQMNELVFADDRVDNALFPIRDGMMLIQKK